MVGLPRCARSGSVRSKRRATLRWLRLKTDRRSTWLRGLMARRGKNKAAGALANKNARIAWVLLTTDQVYIAEQAAA